MAYPRKVFGALASDLLSSSPPPPYAAPAPLAPSPTQLSTSSLINCRGDVMAKAARSKFVFKSEGESCTQTGFEMLDHHNTTYQARAQSARARRACALRALGLLLADGAPTVGRGKTF